MQKKACDKIQCTFMIRGKKAMSLGIEGDFHHMIKDIYEKPTHSIILSGERLATFSQDQAWDNDVHIPCCYSTLY